MATSNRALNAAQTAGNRTNPFAFPPGETPLRPFAEFASALVTGRSTDGTVAYEDATLNPVPLFQDPAPVPLLPWKTDPAVGHLMGVVKDEATQPVDTGAVTLTPVEGTASVGRHDVATTTDGAGFYGGVDLAPGTYQATVTPPGQAPWTAACTAAVTAGNVARLDLVVDRLAPSTTIGVDPDQLWPPNHEMKPVVVTGVAGDPGGGLVSVSVRVIDEYGLVEPEPPPVALDGVGPLEWKVGFLLEASRRGGDKDGGTYTIVVTVTDRSCNATEAHTTVVVPHDQGKN